MIKAVIFDLDGVLLDNTPIIVKIFQEDAKIAGIKIPTRKSIINTLGSTWTEMVEKLLGKDEKYKKIHREVWKKYEGKMALMAGAKKILRRLKKEKAIVTSKPRAAAIRQLKGKDILYYFKFIIAAEDAKNHKPHPDPLLKACNKLNVNPSEAVYVGDFIRDFEMAKNAGAGFIGILSGAMSELEFRKAGVEKIIHSLPELLEMIK